VVGPAGGAGDQHHGTPLGKFTRLLTAAFGAGSGGKAKSHGTSCSGLVGGRSQDAPVDDARSRADVRTFGIWVSEMFPSELEPIPLLMGSFQSDRGIGNEMVKITGSAQRHGLRWMSRGLRKPPMRSGRNQLAGVRGANVASQDYC
jgi:hypothetical protein